MILCNNDKCQFQTAAQHCLLDEQHREVCYVDRTCMSFRRKPQRENMGVLMQAPFRSGCHKTQGGYKSDRVVNILK